MEVSTVVVRRLPICSQDESWCSHGNHMLFFCPTFTVFSSKSCSEHALTNHSSPTLHPRGSRNRYLMGQSQAWPIRTSCPLWVSHRCASHPRNRPAQLRSPTQPENTTHWLPIAPVYCCCFNIFSQTQWLKTTQIYNLWFSLVRSLVSSVISLLRFTGQEQGILSLTSFIFE